ncbi:MAG TPA: T9SS type A sorting domain-containing protein [Ignavibacteriaceae bacterium]|nr:T9SS type A sorting domain-containing protein [Ignavibacteriaceae bacterium]HRP93684.1 T9SS type A sorting domain-containing protein [Ignavibacteriaceae bacterium]HRQ54362.1 T9SS type A sorting domain-containing protein [Ignavibacteriaceae bacterium]
MKTNKLALLAFAILLLSHSLIFAQFIPRQDAIWARYVPAGTITMDGILNEAAWAQAESVTITYGQPGLLPTSGYKKETDGGPGVVTDPTNATIKFLVASDNQLWLAFDIPDSSIGGTYIWPKFDAILMSVKNKLQLNGSSLMASPSDIFYTFYTNGLPDSTPVVGSLPRIVGSYGSYDGTPRTDREIAIVDARTVVNGTSNDAGRDQRWVTEIRVNLDSLGYDVNQTDGDVIALNFSIWDNDFLFENDPLKMYSTRTHYQAPWGNANEINVARIYGKPDVGLTSTLPEIAPDVIIPNGVNYPDPVIDGKPDEAVWSGAYTFNLGWDIQTLREDYPGIGKFMSGRYQPSFTTPPSFPPIIDPSFAVIKMFFKDKYLYFSADVTDGVVSGTTIFDLIDGVRLVLGHRTELNDVENNMVFKNCRVSFSFTGLGAPYEYLKTLVDSGRAQFGAALKGATTVNNNTDFDEGYTIEMKIDLTGLGYSADLGDKALFCGVMLADGDTFEDPLSNYGSRVWWFRELEGGPTSTWAILDPGTLVGVKDDKLISIPSSIQLYGNYPNPFNPSTTIKFAVPESGDVNIIIFNTLGEEIESVKLLSNNGGESEYSFNASSISSGVYFYKIALNNSASGRNYVSKVGKMILLK